MKDISAILCVLFILLSFGCRHQEEPDPILSGRISFTPGMYGEAGSRITESLPEGSYLVISLETQNGTEVLTQHKLPLLRIDGEYITPPLKLDVGDYRLTDFMVTVGSEVIYATPKKGSKLADAVTSPLPITFSISEQELTVLSPEVLDVAKVLPEDMGYVTFRLIRIEYFFAAVFKPDVAEPMIDANLFLLVDGDTVRTQHLGLKVNAVGFEGREDQEFTLVVLKEGYGKYSRNFTVKDISETYEQSVVPILLEPALTFRAVPWQPWDDPVHRFEFNLGYEGEITIDWGDGNVQSRSSTSFQENFDHDYEGPGFYFVSVTGDIKKIRSFKSYYGLGPMMEINLEHLSALKDFRCGWNGDLSSPPIIDLSANHKLVYVDVSLNHDLERLILPSVNEILSLNIFGPNRLSTSDIDEIINPVYHSVVVDPRYGGYIDLESPDDGSVAGPPSAQTLEKLRDLRDTYAWQINPDPDELSM